MESFHTISWIIICLFGLIHTHTTCLDLEAETLEWINVTNVVVDWLCFYIPCPFLIRSDSRSPDPQTITRPDPHLKPETLTTGPQCLIPSLPSLPIPFCLPPGGWIYMSQFGSPEIISITNSDRYSHWGLACCGRAERMDNVAWLITLFPRFATDPSLHLPCAFFLHAWCPA